MSNSFLPTDYEAPAQATGNYLNISKIPNDKPIKIRILGSAVVGYEYWTNENKPMRSKKPFLEVPGDARLDEKNQFVAKHFWAFPVWVYPNECGVEEGVKIFQVTQQTIRHTLEALVNNEDWGSPEDINTTGFLYDIAIVKTGEKLTTKYTLTPAPINKKTDPEMQMHTFNEMKIDLSKLFSGENPFAM